MQICKEIKKCKKHKNYKKMNLKFGRRYRSSYIVLLYSISSVDNTVQTFSSLVRKVWTIIVLER